MYSDSTIYQINEYFYEFLLKMLKKDLERKRYSEQDLEGLVENDTHV